MKSTDIPIGEIDNAVKYKNKEDGYNMDKKLLKKLEESYIRNAKRRRTPITV